MSQNNPLPRRKPFQIYVPVHRRNNTQSESASPTKSIDSTTTTTTTTTNTSTCSQDDGLVRRGRGRFRAPSSSPTSGHSPIQSPCPSNNDKQQQQQQQQQQQSIVNDSKSSSSNHSCLSVSGNPASPLTTPTKNTITDENLAASMEKSLSLESKEDWEQLDDELELENNNNKNTGKSKGKKVILMHVHSITQLPFIAKKSIPASSSPPPPPPPIEAGTTILDCSGFPASFKTYHIQDMFRIYEDMPGSFKIKWMDDTRALIIFGSAATGKYLFMI